MSPLLKGKTAFITGGAQGIGLAVAQRFCQEGASVTLGDVRLGEAESAAHRLREDGYDARAVRVDVTDEISLEEAAQAHGATDILVANAGLLHLSPVLDTDRKDWQKIIDVNLTGAFLTCKVFARRMVERGEGGRIVITSSLFGRRGGMENAAYSASKFGVIGLAESLAAEIAPHDILVNAVCPGQVDTEMMSELFEERAESRNLGTGEVEAEMLAKIPLGRMASPEEIGDVFVFLASDLSRYVTGQSLVADGGWMVGP